MTISGTGRALVLLGLAMAIGASTIHAPAASADLPPSCETRPWGFLGSETRFICDEPIRPDGSWTRRRIIGVPRHYQNPSSRCSSGRYDSYCTYYPGGWVEDKISSKDTYEVRADTIPPDEPGHMPDPAPVPPPPPEAPAP
ncbi:hypothetical protein [Mycobacterium sp. NPDC050441]|uniref:CDGP domain-containing protein n=1 Tax=Mycobacterium sp. NPDC050441 TaxID=3155403 RepID=UPI00340916A3